MNTLIKTSRVKIYFLIALFGLIIGYAGSTLAITVTVGANKQLAPNVKAIGFSIVGKKGSYGWLGHTYKRSSLPAGTYSFGFRNKQGKDVSCGTAKLTKDSIVVLQMSGSKCTVSVR